MELFSCDTMVALGNSTRSGRVIFAKNSDRPLTEPQPMHVVHAADHDPAKKMKCTYIEISQAAHTFAVLGSKPDWIWGFEHGVNEHGVVIGNEAVWSKVPEEESPGLIGMDLVRLALERGASAYEAMHIIIDLLERYGQGGSCAKDSDFRYHNAFLIADSKEAWILETVRRMWVARRVKDVDGISNCYSTGESWDEASQNIVSFAIEQGWASNHQPFHFAKAYSAMTTKHSGSFLRYKRLNKLLRKNIGNIDCDTMKSILRDHFEDELLAPRWSPADALNVYICMHCLDETFSKTAAGFVLEFREDSNFTVWNCFSNPCTSIFGPLYMTGVLPEGYSDAQQHYTESSAWWKLERLCYAIEANYPSYIQKLIPVRKKLEQEFAAEAARVEAETALLDPAERNALLNEFSQRCGRLIAETADLLYGELAADLASGTAQTELQRAPVLKIARDRAGL